MITTCLEWNLTRGWNVAPASLKNDAHLVLYFGSSKLLSESAGPLAELMENFPQAVVAGCSTAGEIFGGTVSDESIAVICVKFAGTKVRAAAVNVSDALASHAAALTLGRQLAAPDLRHVLVLSDGLQVNGTALTAGFRISLPPQVHVTGGLAGDGSNFKRTLVGLGRDVAPGRVVAVGFYGDKIRLSHGSAGGWEAFGPRRLITKSAGNLLQTLDGQPALPLYKTYLGDRAAGLPATGLLFPLELLTDKTAEHGLVRTILAVDESNQSLTFAGDLPEGCYVRLMKANTDALIDGAESAGRLAVTTDDATGGFAVLVSCVGRRLVMGQRIEEEVEAVIGQIGRGISVAGFYSYGEICPSGLVHSCNLHNQTMTLTVFTEAA
jgi:hypothetical protein